MVIDDGAAVQAAAARRVVVVITGVEDFGIRTFLLTQFRHAHEVGICFSYLAAQDGDCAKALRAVGAPVNIAGGDIALGHPGHPVLLPFFWLLRLPGVFRAYRGMRRFLKGAGCEILYAQSYYGLILCRVAARGLNCRVAGQLHNNLNERRLLGLQRIVVSLVLAVVADRLVAISDFVAGSLWGPARRKVCRIYNGVDVAAIAAAVQGIAEQPNRIVTVGRLVAWKKQEVAIQAINILRERGVDCELEIVGGPGAASDRYQQWLRDLVATLDVGDRVRFAGVVSPAFRRIAAAAACVSCATHEPFGLVVVEAAACGTAVVAADAGGTAELIEHGKTGLLFRPDDPVALADALESLLGNAPLRESLARAAHQRACARYDITRHLRALRSCLDALVAQP